MDRKFRLSGGTRRGRNRRRRAASCSNWRSRRRSVECSCGGWPTSSRWIAPRSSASTVPASTTASLASLCCNRHKTDVMDVVGGFGNEFSIDFSRFRVIFNRFLLVLGGFWVIFNRFLKDFQRFLEILGFFNRFMDVSGDF